MKTHFYIISLIFISFLSFSSSYAQQQDSLKQKQIRFFSKVLNTKQDTAVQVSTIINSYKESLKKVIADATLSEDTRRVKINGLIEEKNKKLGLILSPSQLEKIIPSTERKRNQVNNTKQF